MAEANIPESNVKQVQASDGSTFDMMRGGFDEDHRGEIRGNALSQMKSIAERREPDLLPHLSYRASYEYLSSSAIGNAKDPAVKADLVRIAVRGWVSEGARD